ncbi:SDR family NAD(P)-dependent oxidoreductase [Novosphingobium sp. G106]|uniref:SDR family NAD(P)-dependent oxidoreductase n=1 Tax=Novosphingobium sp. G106 TaxID=2849500 RepID=UPI001C2DD4D5|nr:SDR family NAD(P)-dependent oxidoreductase [Novosphingobium sp. G106]MBV1689388.1 SDR family NAD(P)-dependent oxidoreductase [Novosphingobium sp. G106]
MRQLEGKVCLITGAGGGLGRACARLFAREGANVLIADIDAAAGEDAAAEIGALGWKRRSSGPMSAKPPMRAP